MTAATRAVGPVTRVAEGIQVAVRVTPGAARDGVTGLATDADGTVRLKVGVTAPPENGKANAAVSALLAKTWGVQLARVTVSAGATGRNKTLLIEGDPEDLGAAIGAWIEDMRR